MSFSKIFQSAIFAACFFTAIWQPQIAVAAGELKSENPLEREFFAALKFIGENQFAQASERFAQLKALGAQAGFENMSGFSLTLLENTEVLLAKQERDKAAFVLRRAQDLSPGDARVVLGVARFSELLGFRERVSIGAHGVWLALFSPVVATTLAVNTMLIGLTSLTLALLFVCVLQFARHGDLVFQVVGKFVSPNARGAFTPLAVLAALILPVLFGVLFALVCWTLLLAKVFAPGKKLASCVGILALAWGLALPVLNVSLGNSASKLAWVLEGQRIRSFVPRASQYLAETSKKNSDPVVQFGLAQALFVSGKNEEAKQRYGEILKRTSAESKFGKVIQFHLAAIDLAEQKFDAARASLEKLEPDFPKSFELFYNLSLVRLGQLDTEGQRKYYELARDLDSARLTRLELEALERPFPLLPQAPSWQFVPFLLKLHDLKEQQPGERPFGQAGRVASALVIGTSPALLVVLGICVFVFSLLVRPAFSNMDGESSNVNTSWRLIPGGEFFAGRAPTTGACILALFLGLILAATETPIHLVPIVPLSRSAAPLFFAISAIVFIVSLMWASIHAKLRRAR